MKTLRLVFNSCVIISHCSHSAIPYSAPGVWTWKVRKSKFHAKPVEWEAYLKKKKPTSFQVSKGCDVSEITSIYPRIFPFPNKYGHAKDQVNVVGASHQ